MAASKYSCTPCSRNSTSSEARKYCTDCEEGLCKECLHAHSLFKAFASHHLVDPGSFSTNAFSIQKFCTEHSNMALDFFCADHDCMCCRACMAEKHRVCQKFIPLEVAAKGVKRSPMFEDISGTLSNIRTTLDKLIKNRDNNITSLDADEATVVKEVASIKANILKQLNDIEEKILSEVKSFKRKGKSKIDSDKDNLLKMKKSVEEISNQVEFVSKHGSENQIFVLLNTRKLELLNHETRIQEMIPSLETTQIKFKHPDEKKPTIGSLGSIKMESVPCHVKYKPPKIQQVQAFVPPQQTSTNFKLDCELDIKSTGDVSITSIAVTDDNRLLLCNFESTKVLVYNDRGEYLQDCTLSGAPCGIAVISGEDKAVVSLWFKTSIQFVDTKSITAGSTHSVPGKCPGIAVVNDKICVGGLGKLYILDKQGNQTNKITVPDVGYLFYLHPGPQDSVYYTNYSDRTGSVKLNGENCFTYSSGSSKRPAAVITDKGGNLFIACTDSNNIQRLSSEGKFLDIILGEENEIKEPTGIAFSKDYRQLFVSNNKGQSVLIFSCS